MSQSQDEHQLTNYIHNEITSLRKDMDQRFQGMERWIERVTNAIDKITEYQKQTAVNEAKITQLEKDVEKIQLINAEQSDEQQRLSRIFFKIAFIASIVAGIVSVVIGPFLKQLLEMWIS